MGNSLNNNFGFGIGLDLYTLQQRHGNIHEHAEKIFKKEGLGGFEKETTDTPTANKTSPDGWWNSSNTYEVTDKCKQIMPEENDKKYYMFLEHKGYVGSVDFSKEDSIFYGRIEDIKDLVSFEGVTEEGVRQNFIDAVNDYLSDCKDEEDFRIATEEAVLEGTDNIIDKDSLNGYWKQDKTFEEIKKSYEDTVELYKMGIFPQDSTKNIKEGKKDNNTKLPMSILFKQFPRALQAVVLASSYGNFKYKEVDKDWMNFSRVKEGSKAYNDADIRHQLDKEIYGENDSESSLPHIFHETFDKLAKCELYLIENNIDIKDFSKNYLKELYNK